MTCVGGALTLGLQVRGVDGTGAAAVYHSISVSIPVNTAVRTIATSVLPVYIRAVAVVIA